MKKTNWLLAILLMSLFLFACGTDSEDQDPNTLGGDSNIALAEVGNTGYTVVGLNGNYTRLEGIEITDKKNGVVTIHIDTDISNVDGLGEVVKLIAPIYPSLLDDDGKIRTDLTYKLTSEGIQDFNNIDGKAHTLVKYDCEVGDTYPLKLSNGKTITRKVVAKSSQDDFAWGFMLIKTVTVEQNAVVPGIEKFVFKANHRFGLVFVEAVMEDGSSIELYVYPSNY